MLSGPNRGGKTTAGAYGDSCALLGKDRFRPWREYKLPTLVWAVALDNKRLGKTLERKIVSMLPPGSFKHYRQDQIIQMYRKWGGSELHFMSCEAGPDRFKGAGPDRIHLDEEPTPRGDEIFNECLARIEPDRDLEIDMTFTPDQGATWSCGRLYDETHEDYLRGPNGEKVVEFFNFSLWDCDIRLGGHMPYEKILAQYHKYKPHERAARFFGRYSLVGSNTYYEGELIDAARKRVRQGEPAKITINELKQTKLERGPYGEGLLFEERIPGERYIAGFDLSGGTRKDRSVAYVIAMGLKRRVIDNLGQEQIAQGNLKPRLAYRWKSDRIDAAKFAIEIAYPMLMHYNQALACPERNGQYGGAFITALSEVYDNFYSDLRWDQQKLRYSGGIGWHTNDSSRGRILAVHDRWLREGHDVYTATCIQELSTIINKKLANGQEKTEAAYGCHDDEPFAAGVAGCAYYEDPPIVTPPDEECAEMYTFEHDHQELMV